MKSFTNRFSLQINPKYFQENTVGPDKQHPQPYLSSQNYQDKIPQSPFLQYKSRQLLNNATQIYRRQMKMNVIFFVGQSITPRKTITKLANKLQKFENEETNVRPTTTNIISSTDINARNKKFSIINNNSEKLNELQDINLPEKNFEPRISIMTLQLKSLERESQKRKQQFEETQILNVLIEKRRQQKKYLRQQAKENSKKKVFSLLQKNYRVGFQGQNNFKTIKQIITQMKHIRNFQDNKQHLEILALEGTFSSKKSLNKNIKTLSSKRFSNSINKKSDNENYSKKKVQKMIFGLNDFKSENNYKNKLYAFFQFLYKINFSNNIYIDMKIKQPLAYHNNIKYKVFIGYGNNSILIRNLIQRRFWMQIVQNPQQQNISFYWTQLTLKKIHQNQQKSKRQPLTQQIIKKIHLLKSKKNPLKDQNYKILSRADGIMVENYLSNFSIKNSIYQKFIVGVVTNHIPQNSVIGSKKALFHSMYFYYKNICNKNPFDFIPETFHIKNLNDERLRQLLTIIQNQRQNRIWILKPGQNSNRGTGISLINSKDIYTKLCKKFANPINSQQENTYIIQSYINKPFLYHNRKFDIRHYMMVTSVNGIFKAFWYQQGYIRTSSLVYNIEDIQNILIHLTNDAIQKNGQFYGKYELANKVSYAEFQRYLDINFPGKKYNFEFQILQKMKEMTLDIVRANFSKLDAKRKLNNFQIFGLDFMIDHNFKPWLIEVNSNPCLQIPCPLLQSIIPTLVQNAFKIGLDPLFPPTSDYPLNKRYLISNNILQNLKFELIFDQKVDGQKIKKLFQECNEKQQQLLIETDNEQEFDEQCNKQKYN